MTMAMYDATVATWESKYAPVRKRVLRQMLAAEVEASQDTIRSTTHITSENYTFQYVATEERGRTCHFLIVEPRVPNKFLSRNPCWANLVRPSAAPLPYMCSIDQTFPARRRKIRRRPTSESLASCSITRRKHAWSRDAHAI